MINLSEMKDRIVVRTVFVVTLMLIGFFLALIGLTVGVGRHNIDVTLYDIKTATPTPRCPGEFFI